MTQQYVFGNANDRYKKKLFVDTGFEYIEVKARVVEPYSPPAPQPNLREIKIQNAPSHFHQLGISSYKASMNLLFNSKQDYHDYLTLCGWTHKFYDEQGNIYLGALESIKAQPYEGNRRYKVEVSFVFVKKDAYDRKHRFEFQDIETHWAQQDIEEMSDLGLVVVVSKDGDPELYFRPNDYTTRAEFITFLNRTRRLVERIIRE